MELFDFTFAVELSCIFTMHTVSTNKVDVLHILFSNFTWLRVDIRPSEDSPLLEDWDIISPKDVIGSDVLLAEKRSSLTTAALPSTQSIFSQVGRTLSQVQQVLSWSYGEDMKPFKPPLSDAEFHTYLNHEGQLSAPEEPSSSRLRVDIRPSEDSPLLEDWDIISPKDVIGSDVLLAEKRSSLTTAALPSTQSIFSQVGRTLSQVQQVLSWSYGEDMKPFKPPLSDAEFHTYLNHEGQLSAPELKSEWAQRASPEDLEFIRSRVLKDVLRTNRAHPYYAGLEDGPHLRALHDLFTTYAVTHPPGSYCQGMSGLGSPILAAMDHEGYTFVCFCGIRKCLAANFHPDGHTVAIKFAHLKLLLRHADPDFYQYLQEASADDLFFCYRRLLLELKQEFAFDDALRMLEVTWSSLPPDPAEHEVELVGTPSQVADTGFSGRRGRPVRQQHMLRPAGSGGGGTFEDVADHLARSSQGPGGGGLLLRQASPDGLQQLRDNMGSWRNPRVQLPTLLPSSAPSPSLSPY
ncbi:TBC1 domain family member 25 [Heterocephalus glaber]|uniref:TBC1 domain family member 25 n=1 Tax=Heterocephalus glaber TaxID=10181 RepID=G5C5G4_HETGA|nr:TBC1 domain family member 25 [Heterocephalus glaber]